jgi:hypothetical protein
LLEIEKNKKEKETIYGEHYKEQLYLVQNVIKTLKNIFTITVNVKIPHDSHIFSYNYDGSKIDVLLLQFRCCFLLFFWHEDNYAEIWKSTLAGCHPVHLYLV